MTAMACWSERQKRQEGKEETHRKHWNMPISVHWAESTFCSVIAVFTTSRVEKTLPGADWLYSNRLFKLRLLNRHWIDVILLGYTVQVRNLISYVQLIPTWIWLMADQLYVNDRVHDCFAFQDGTQIEWMHASLAIWKSRQKMICRRTKNLLLSQLQAA